MRRLLTDRRSTVTSFLIAMLVGAAEALARRHIQNSLTASAIDALEEQLHARQSASA